MTAQDIVAQMNNFHIALIRHLEDDPGLFGEMKGSYFTQVRNWGLVTVGPERMIPGGKPNVDWAEVDLTDLGREVLDILITRDEMTPVTGDTNSSYPEKGQIWKATKDPYPERGLKWSNPWTLDREYKIVSVTTLRLSPPLIAFQMVGENPEPEVWEVVEETFLLGFEFVRQAEAQALLPEA
jgi:hypothetical protein